MDLSLEVVHEFLLWGTAIEDWFNSFHCRRTSPALLPDPRPVRECEQPEVHRRSQKRFRWREEHTESSARIQTDDRQKDTRPSGFIRTCNEKGVGCFYGKTSDGHCLSRIGADNSLLIQPTSTCFEITRSTNFCTAPMWEGLKNISQRWY